MVMINVRVTAAILPPSSHRMKYTATTSTAMCHTPNPEGRKEDVIMRYYTASGININFK